MQPRHHTGVSKALSPAQTPTIYLFSGIEHKSKGNRFSQRCPSFITSNLTPSVLPMRCVSSQTFALCQKSLHFLSFITLHSAFNISHLPAPGAVHVWKWRFLWRLALESGDMLPSVRFPREVSSLRQSGRQEKASEGLALSLYGQRSRILPQSFPG